MNSFQTALKIILPGIFLLPVIQLKSQDSERSLELKAGFTGDMVQNFAGGLKTGTTGLSLINLSVSFDTEKAKMWKGGTFFVHGHTFAGKHPSESLIGDVQVASNIDGYCNRLLYELWYEQKVNNFSVLAGYQNLNEKFYASSYAGCFLNSSFGISPSLSLNNPISIFPATTLGGVLRYEKESFSLLGGFYNMDHDFTRESGLNINHHLFQHGFYSIIESQFRWNKNNLKGEYKFGGCFRRCNTGHESASPECNRQNNYGLYFLADQTFYHSENSGKDIGFFVQTGYSPEKYNPSPIYASGGINLKGFFTRRGEDILGIAWASAQINQFNETTQLFVYRNNESVVEVTYRLPLTANISIQPDTQYIINPDGGSSLNNAFVGIIRTQIDF